MLYGTMVRPISAFMIHRGDCGFTLLERLAVTVIVGRLACVAPRYFSRLGQFEVRSAQAQSVALLGQ